GGGFASAADQEQRGTEQQRMDRVRYEHGIRRPPPGGPGPEYAFRSAPTRGRTGRWRRQTRGPDGDPASERGDSKPDAELGLDRLHRPRVLAGLVDADAVEGGQREHHAILELDEDRLARVVVAHRAVELDAVAPAIAQRGLPSGRE